MNWITQDWFESHECSSHHPPTDQLSNVQNSCRIGKAVYPPAFYPISWPCNKLISQWNSIGNTIKITQTQQLEKATSFLPSLLPRHLVYKNDHSFLVFLVFLSTTPTCTRATTGLPCFFIRLHKEATVPRKIVCHGESPHSSIRMWGDHWLMIPSTTRGGTVVDPLVVDPLVVEGMVDVGGVFS